MDAARTVDAEEADELEAAEAGREILSGSIVSSTGAGVTVRWDDARLITEGAREGVIDAVSGTTVSVRRPEEARDAIDVAGDAGLEVSPSSRAVVNDARDMIDAEREGGAILSKGDDSVD